ncbi:YwqJ-related putative deaminase [Frankia sp. Cj3]|uniref:YwqJ-related putative deaminase n=1 Tax=Frankia sp. Cj3 TaxID=2880976 RepID=UPI0035ADBB8C
MPARPDGLRDYYWFPDIAVVPDVLPAPVGGPVAGGAGGLSSRVDGRVASRAGRSPQVRSRLPVPALPAPRVKPVPSAGPAWSGPSTIAPPGGWSAAGTPLELAECVPGTCADSLPSGDGASGQGTDGGCGLAEGSLPLAATCVPDGPDPDPAAAGGKGRPPGDGNPPAPPTSPASPDDGNPNRDDDLAARLRKAVQDRYYSITDRTSSEYQSIRQRGPVLTGVIDKQTGEIFFGQNTGIPEPLYPELQARLNEFEGPHAAGKGTPGAHSEINALNQGLWARLDADVEDFLIYNLRLRGAGQGMPIARCPNCVVLTRGAEEIP